MKYYDNYKNNYKYPTTSNKNNYINIKKINIKISRYSMKEISIS